MVSRRAKTDADAPSAPVALPLSSKLDAQAALAAALEHEIDDDHVRLDDDRPYSSRPDAAAARMLTRLEALLPASAKRCILDARAPLARHLEETALDDVDGESLLAWIVEDAGIVFVDDSRALPAALEGDLRATLASVVIESVRDDVSIPTFAHAVSDAAQAWADRHLQASIPLESFRSSVDRSFAGVAMVRDAERRTELVEELTQQLVRMLRIRWVRDSGAARPYSASAVFEVGDRVLHSKFGEGTVGSKLDGKVEIDFVDGRRVLAAGKPVRGG